MTDKMLAHRDGGVTATFEGADIVLGQREPTSVREVLGPSSSSRLIAFDGPEAAEHHQAKKSNN